MLGNHLPRQCGIATFTADLSAAIGAEYSGLDCFVLAMNDPGQRHRYPERVRFEIDETDIDSYRRAADFLNVSSVDVVSVQHEYGIFGGKAGSHVLALLGHLRMPIVTTLHTILANPTPQQRSVMDKITRLSERLVVMSEQGAAVLKEVHSIADSKIDIIPHGIPTLPSETDSKMALGVEGKAVLLTFGLLSPDKGIEHVIDALPAILQSHPETLYIVVGATHPHVREHHGETYRIMLENRAQRLGVASNMIFHNRFVSQQELTEFLSAADIYITPYLKAEQSTSGTLAYAVGSGKPVVSTPYAYAQELLAGGRGVLVPWPHADPTGIGRAVTALLDDDEARNELCQRGAAYGRDMLWPAVARSYRRCFDRARTERSQRLRTVFRANTLAERPLALPEIRLAHLARLTDDTGLAQHAAFTVPRYEDGYCVDDNARALLLTTLLEAARIEDLEFVRTLASRYMAFTRHAFDPTTGRFRNFMTYARNWVDGPGSEDCHGRALWGLGTVVGQSEDPGLRSVAESLFRDALPVVSTFTSPRAWAYTLLGIDEYLRSFAGDGHVQTAREQLAERLLSLYRKNSTSAWPWFEVRATYCNARLSQALLVSGARMVDHEMQAAGLRSLEWLAEIQRSTSGAGYFEPIGSNGFFEKGGKRASFDQQPVEVCTMVSACLEAERLTNDEDWAAEARRAFDWFVGQNQLNQPLYDARTGGCRDGLHQDRRNENQGAESTLSFLMALVEMNLRAQAAPVRVEGGNTRNGATACDTLEGR